MTGFRPLLLRTTSCALCAGTRVVRAHEPWGTLHARVIPCPACVSAGPLLHDLLRKEKP